LGWVITQCHNITHLKPHFVKAEFGGDPSGGKDVSELVFRRFSEGPSAHLYSQSPIGIVKRNHALNIPSRIENSNLAGTKSGAGFRIANCLIFLKKHGFNAGWIQRRTSPTCEVLRQLLSSQRSAEAANSCVILSNSRNADRISSDRTTNLLPLSWCPSTIQIVRPQESTAEMQPQLHPALLRLSAIISQYWMFRRG
jgi:hypothetical protein